MFPLEALRPWIPLAAGAAVLLVLVALIARAIRSQLLRLAFVVPLALLALKLGWDYVVRAGL